jgi:hypothetical protein
VADGPELEDPQLDLDPAALATPVMARPGENVLTEIAQLLDLDAEVIPRAGPVRKRLYDALVTAVDPCTRLPRRLGELDLGVEVREAQLELPSRIGRVHPPDKLDVLARHGCQYRGIPAAVLDIAPHKGGVSARRH